MPGLKAFGLGMGFWGKVGSAGSWLRNNPLHTTAIGMGIGGAAIGAMSSNDGNRLRGAAIGAGLGVGAAYGGYYGGRYALSNRPINDFVAKAAVKGFGMRSRGFIKGLRGLLPPPA